MTRAKQIVYLGILILASLSLSVTLVVVFSPFLYYVSLSWLNLEEVSGLSESALMQNFRDMWTYLINPMSRSFSFTDFSASPQGLQHFADVKGLMLANFILTIVGLFVSYRVIHFIRQKRKKRYFKHSIQWAYLLPLGFLLIAILAFEPLFLFFHQIFFRNDYWVFDPLTDPIISVLPQEFFLICFVAIVIIYEIIIMVMNQCIQRK